MSKRAFYSASLADFLVSSTDSIIGVISRNHSQQIEHLQTGAWVSQIELLRNQLAIFSDGYILFELLIPRMGRRADVVFICQDIIFVIEFKVGAHGYHASDLRQAHGYAIDLHHFHEGSHNKTIVPILLATEAGHRTTEIRPMCDLVHPPMFANKENLSDVIERSLSGIPRGATIDYCDWIASAYKPTPTIIEAAQALYANHDVEDIARNDAGATNLNTTSNAIRDIVHAAHLNSHKSICFVTGVPGAGKTLVGLNIATSGLDAHTDEHAVFLSGNGSLVEVLTDALARDSVSRNPGATKANELRSAQAKIQNIHKFRDESLTDLTKAPPERVVIFDEAQRAWDAENTSKFMTQKRNQTGFNQSEPEFLISVMDRHTDWCVIVALIGGGQEINTGETGLQGWLDALALRFPHWHVHYSDKLVQHEYAGRDVEFGGLSNAYPKSSLHLANSMRSFRAEKLSHMVHHLIHNDAQNAFALYQSIKENFSVKVTRNLASAKKWIRSQARANETKGVVASSGGVRLKPEGVFVKARFHAAEWFLNDPSDVRSCHYLEDVATEFDIQGLELDWCLVAWDANYRYQNSQFEHWKFSGTTWKRILQLEQKRFLENAYRVLLTRARQGMIIYLPIGSSTDPTRPEDYFDQTFAYLLSCGVEVLT